MQRSLRVLAPILLLWLVAGCADPESSVEAVRCVPDDSSGDAAGHGGGGSGADEPSDGGTSSSDSDADGVAQGGDDGGTSSEDGALQEPGGPPPDGEWVNVTSNLAGMASECGNMSLIATKPDEDKLIAGIAAKGLWVSTDGGESWSPLGRGEGSEVIANRPSFLTFDPTNPSTFWESGIYSTGVFKTSDNGETFRKLGELNHCDAVVVDFGDPERKLLIATGHETSQTVFRSNDGGQSWTNIGAGLPEDQNCNAPLILDSTTYLVGCSHFSRGIYRTTDAGLSWTRVASDGGKGMPLQASDGSIWWATEGGGGFYRSEDDGETWKVVGASTSFATQGVAPVELPDGRIAAVGKEAILVTSDGGETWRAVSTKLPIAQEAISGFIYSTHQAAFFIKHFTCETNVPDNAVMRYDLALNPTR